MDAQEVVDLAREALWIGLLISAPVLLAGIVVGLVVSFLQALTQIQEQSISFVPKILAMTIAFAAALPWLVAIMVEYSRELIARIPAAL